MRISSWRVWVPTGGAVAALLVMLTPNAGPAAPVAPPVAVAAAQSDAACTAPSVPAPAASTDYFLKLDGIQGGSTDSKHPGEISISSFVWGINMDRTGCSGVMPGGSTGGGAGKARFSEVQFVKTIDKSSPKLAQAAATGKHIPRAVLTARKAGRDQQEFLVITLTEVSITSYSISASTSSMPQDTFGVSYAQLNYQFFPQRPDGSLDPPVTVCLTMTAGKTC